MHKDRLHGGVADYVGSIQFDTEALVKGTKHELEHTDDPDIAMEIAMDHLAENPWYYEELEKMEKHENYIRKYISSII